MKMISIIPLLLVLVAGCKKPVLAPLPPMPTCFLGLCDTSKLEIVWQKPIWADTLELSSMPALLFESKVAFSQQTFSLTDTIKFFDKLTGEQTLIWADYFPDKIKSMLGSSPLKIGNSIVFTTWNDVYAINTTTAKTIWQTAVTSGDGNPFLNNTGNTIYHGHYERRNATKYVSYLVAANASTGRWDTVHTQPKINNHQPFHGKPALWVNAAGDSIIVFQLTFMDPAKGPLDERTDIIAVNLKTKQEYFRLADADIGHTGSRRFPYLVGNNMFVPLGANMVCIDMPSKTIKWRRQFDAGFTSGQPFIYVEGKFFVKPDNRTLYQLDMETGNILWQDLENGSGPSDMVYYKGVLYYTCSGNGKIYAVEVATGKKLWAEPSPNKFKHPLNGNRRFGNANIGFGGVAIDTVHNYLYTSDFYFHMCLRLPKR